MKRYLIFLYPTNNAAGGIYDLWGTVDLECEIVDTLKRWIFEYEIDPKGWAAHYLDVDTDNVIDVGLEDL